MSFLLFKSEELSGRTEGFKEFKDRLFNAGLFVDGGDSIKEALKKH